jgi:hypothetical protein
LLLRVCGDKSTLIFENAKRLGLFFWKKRLCLFIGFMLIHSFFIVLITEFFPDQIFTI